MEQMTNPEQGVTGELTDEQIVDALIVEPEQAKPEEQPQQQAEAEEKSEEAESDESNRDEAEDEAETEEGDEPETDEAEDEAEDGDEEGEPELYTVKVDGEEVEVTKDQLLSGYMMQADYQRKTQDLAEQRRELHQKHTEFEQTAQTKMQELEFLTTQMLDEFTKVDEGTNWEELRQYDPAEFAAKQADLQRKREQLARAYQAHQEIKQQQQAHEAEVQKARLADERELLTTKIPEWVDRDVANRERQEIAATLESHGYTKEEISTVADHRLVAILRKAMLYDKTQQTREKAKSKLKKSVPKVRKGGVKGDARTNTAKDAAARFRKTGRDEDLVNFLLTPD